MNQFYAVVSASHLLSSPSCNRTFFRVAVLSRSCLFLVFSLFFPLFSPFMGTATPSPHLVPWTNEAQVRIQRREKSHVDSTTL